jgi:hypothetical protein
MKFIKKIGMLLLAIFLILFGLSGLFDVPIKGLATIEAVLALAAGILIVLDK